ncbi:protein-arginine deiminase type-2 isoform X3 [Corvus moneduloides]|uniref:protein-arginine deiminase type-2 isoform X3 n=1 Tax=Corvus moneduloides TaxID=1196302 RepID=UPI00136341C3|nr:protein-arginine deiminase type-2 isoform X3 [Corvus moneduloides]
MAGEMPRGERTLRLQHGSRIEALCVLGGHVRADVFGAAPAGAVAFGVKHTEGVSVDVLFRGRAEPEAVPGAGTRWPLDEGTALRFSMSRASSEVNDNKVTVSFFAEGGKPINQAGVFLTGVGISLDVDADQDGVVEKNSPNKGIPHSPIFTDTVVFRVAPWIMTPSTLAPVNLFVCSMKDNYLFTKEIQTLAAKAGCKLKVCFGYINRGDRWMQDEIELGYTHAPHKSFPVVLDSPRERGMEQLPIKELLGPDFGYVHKEPLFEATASLDSFGNVEVSPPVSVAGKEYPLGRILIGSSFPAPAGRRMTGLVRDFLYAQRVQAPVELYSDWLAVGNVNEFVTFVPTSDKKRFRMLLASPAACYRLFREKQKEGQGQATMFKGYSGTDTKRVTINKVLSNDVLTQQNQYVQRCIDWNRDILKKELGLLEEDIIDLPALFKLDKQGKAVPYFPNTVTMIVLAKDLGIPKPFGPVAGGECCLERRIRALLEPLGLCCRFLEDVASYHGSLGEVRCGTNVQRRPFAFKWWHCTP